MARHTPVEFAQNGRAVLPARFSIKVGGVSIEKMKRLKKYLKRVFVILLFVLAGALAGYPYLANYVFEHRTRSAVDSIEQIAEEMDDEEQESAIADAHSYNASLASSGVKLTDPFTADVSSDADGGTDTLEYENLLCMTDDGMMGYVEIPCIDVKLSIYHGTSEATLAKGVGHLHGTSLPVGGDSTHAVLTGHTGLSSAKLFTDLVALEEGDLFFLSVFGEQLAYKVDQVRVVLPQDISRLSIVDGEDYCTLVTCTPYGVNSHRLLVRGARTEYKEAAEESADTGKKKVQSQWMREYGKALLIGVTVLMLLLVLLFLVRWFRRKTIMQ